MAEVLEQEENLSNEKVKTSKKYLQVTFQGISSKQALNLLQVLKEDKKMERIFLIHFSKQDFTVLT